MKQTIKSFMLFGVLCAFGFGLSSCSSDCYECTLAGVTSELCEDDPGSSSEAVDLFVETQEALGATCSKK